MKGRDWQKDWETCEKATRGPWVPVNEPEFDGAIEALNSKLCIAQGVRANDKAFITEARTGWPAALKERARLEKRVRELEEENRCLKAMLDRYIAVLEAAGITANDANIVGKHLKEMGVKHEEI